MNWNDDIEQMLAPLARRLSRTERIVCFSGAGLSAESGIQTFRDGAGDGLWSRFDPMKLASPGGFQEDPELVASWYQWRRRQLLQARPNPAHQALAASRARCVTQNVDNLLERAGVDRDRIVHLHGRIDHDRCNGRCGHRQPMDTDLLENDVALQSCPRCGDHLRPAVVWFGESLPEAALMEADRLCREAEVLIVVGTSGVVWPAAGFIELASGSGAHVININPEPGPMDEHCDVNLRGSAASLLPRLLADAG